MASTSPLVMVFSQDTTTTGSKVNQAGSSNNKSNQDASKSEQQQQQPSSKLPRGRKPSKSSKSPANKNKPRRRGMGIEKLEKWLTPWGGGGDHNLLSADVASGFPLHPHTNHQFQNTPPSLLPVAASPSVYPGSELVISRSSSLPSPFMTASSKAISTLGGKELSSIPKVMQCHQCDASCYSKNKCMYMEEMQGMILGGMNTNRDKLIFPSSLINCHMLTGMNNGQNNVGLEMKDFNSRFMKQMVYNNQDSEMLGITRPQLASSSSFSTLKEYEFFPPGKGLKEYEFFPGSSSGRSYTTRSSEQSIHCYYTSEPSAAAASYFIPSSDLSQQYNAARATNSNALDLSLKLSL